MKIHDWENLPKGTLFKTRRGADGPAVLVNPVDWSEIPFDKDAAHYLGEVECAGTKTSIWSIPESIPDTEETSLE